MTEQQIGEFQRIMNTIDGRDFLYNFVLESCGVDLSAGIPNSTRNEFDAGTKKVAIDIFNLLVYHAHDNFKKMLLEQEQRRLNNGG